MDPGEPLTRFDLDVDEVLAFRHQFQIGAEWLSLAQEVLLVLLEELMLLGFRGRPD